MSEIQAFYYFLLKVPRVSARESPGIPWKKRQDLDEWEKKAVSLYLKYRDLVDRYLKYPEKHLDKEELGSFHALIYHLDRAIEKSSVPPGSLLFRGVDDEYADQFLFLLSIDPGMGDESSCQDVEPHLIQEPGYTSWSSDPARVREETGAGGVLLVYKTGAADPALVLGGTDHEVLLPRNCGWMTTGSIRTGSGGDGVVCISCENPVWGGATE